MGKLRELPNVFETQFMGKEDLISKRFNQITGLKEVGSLNMQKIKKLEQQNSKAEKLITNLEDQVEKFVF